MVIRTGRKWSETAGNERRIYWKPSFTTVCWTWEEEKEEIKEEEEEGEEKGKRPIPNLLHKVTVAASLICDKLPSSRIMMQISCPSKAVNVKAVHRNIACTCNKPTPGQGTVAVTNLPRTMTPVSVTNIQTRKKEKQNTGRKKVLRKKVLPKPQIKMNILRNFNN
jgi:hypothetical protein